jgi:hypothetical protein
VGLAPCKSTAVPHTSQHLSHGEAAAELLAGAHTPREACPTIAEYARVLDTSLACLDPFIYADSSLDDSEAFSDAELSELHASIVEEARDFLNALAP